MIANKRESYIILHSTEEKAFCRNIFFTAWDQGQRAPNVELLHSKKKKKENNEFVQTRFPGIISWW